MILLILQPKLWVIYVFLAAFNLFNGVPSPGADYAYRTPVQGMHFEYIPYGSFLMGSPVSEEGGQDREKPIHSVDIEGFEIMTTEVTCGMWLEVMGEERDSESNCPINFVSWNQAQEFIQRMNELDREYTYRLPTESEWEYACRAGSDTRFFWGETADPKEAGLYAWYDLADDDPIPAAGQKFSNGWGLYDMSGSLWEWCQDEYCSSYDGAPSDGTARESSEDMFRFHRVLRGGSMLNNITGCRSAMRSSYHSSDGMVNIGFRLVRSEN